ncbi:MAG TPA: peptidase MA family metallohydrolase [Geomonas sp.]|nr:peptidase MA family metallohydrolase [Geomonas sp.]
MTTTARFTVHLLLALALFAAPVSAAESFSYTSQANQSIKDSDDEKALEELRSFFSLYPYDETLRRKLADAYLSIADLDLNMSRYTRAAEYYGQAHELYPDHRDYGYLRGIALFNDKKYDPARAEFEQAGAESGPLTYLGKISYNTGDLPAALDYWRKALEREPENKEIQVLIKKAELELPVESKMDKGYSSMFDLSFDAELPPGLSAEVLDALESAYNSVGADLGVFPTTRIPVLLYTKGDYSSVTAGPDWSGGLYDGKIRLPVAGISNLNKQLRAIIFHEYTHVVIGEITHGNVPTWLNEGLAQVEERKEIGHPAVGLADTTREGALIPLTTLSGPFLSMGAAEAGRAYQQSFSMANFMVNRYGWYSIQSILKNLGEMGSIETAVSKALADYSLDLAAVMAEWRESLKKGEQQAASGPKE